MAARNRHPSTIHLDTDWTQYTDAIPQGRIALGTITQDSMTAARVYPPDTQAYFIITPTRRMLLNAQKVKVVIQQAQSALHRPENMIP